MRSSDKKSDVLTNSHDRQIFDSKHDKILMWLFESLNSDEVFLKSILGLAPDFKIYHVEKKIECPITKLDYAFKNRVMGFADMAIYAYEEANGNPCSIVYIEVKSSVNIGETIRQINYYKSFQGPGARWLVCAPKFKGSEILLSQKIGFIEYDYEEPLY